MSINIVYDNKLEDKPLSAAYAATMGKLLASDPNVFTIDADLLGAISGLEDVQNNFPERVMNVGIQEANMIGMAAGLSNAGKKVYVHTFAAFASRRDFDQIFISCAYGKNPIKIFGSDPGICARTNGGTHMPFEDLGMMRTIPDALVLDITDSVMFADLLEQVVDYPSVVYIRSDRSPVVKVYGEDSNFDIGKGIVLREGSDLTIIASGVLVSEALMAADLLEKENISATVIDMFTIKPIDSELIGRYAQKTGAVLTVDNHNINGGLGDAVASVLSENCPTPLKKLGITDRYGEVGSLEYLKENFGIDSKSIARGARELITRKK